MDGVVESSLINAKTNFGLTYDTNWSQLETHSKLDVLVGSLKGDWDSGSGWTVEITDTTYTDIMEFFGTYYTYSGIIAGTTDPSKPEGYIYIKYVYAPYGMVDNYYVIHWQNKTANSIGLSGCSDGIGLPTLEAANKEYTVDSDFFGTHDTFTK
jgi:hypothetical protein